LFHVIAVGDSKMSFEQMTARAEVTSPLDEGYLFNVTQDQFYKYFTIVNLAIVYKAGHYMSGCWNVINEVDY